MQIRTRTGEPMWEILRHQKRTKNGLQSGAVNSLSRYCLTIYQRYMRKLSIDTGLKILLTIGIRLYRRTELRTHVSRGAMLLTRTTNYMMPAVIRFLHPVQKLYGSWSRQELIKNRVYNKLERHFWQRYAMKAFLH